MNACDTETAAVQSSIAFRVFLLSFIKLPLPRFRVFPLAGIVNSLNMSERFCFRTICGKLLIGKP